MPRLPLAYLLFGNVAREAAVVHDWLYHSGACSRKLADEVFAEASETCGVSAWRRGPMWLGVLLFGASRYRAALTSGLEQYRWADCIQARRDNVTYHAFLYLADLSANFCVQ